MSSAFSVSVPQPGASARIGGAIASRPLAVALVLTIVVTALRVGGGVDSDVASQLWIAQRIHEGARLYRDIIEVNPPLWFWMALPVDRLATLLHLRAADVLIAGFGLVVALSLAVLVQLPLDRVEYVGVNDCGHEDSDPLLAGNCGDSGYGFATIAEAYIQGED